MEAGLCQCGGKDGKDRLMINARARRQERSLRRRTYNLQRVRFVCYTVIVVSGQRPNLGLGTSCIPSCCETEKQEDGKWPGPKFARHYPLYLHANEDDSGVCACVQNAVFFSRTKRLFVFVIFLSVFFFFSSSPLANDVPHDNNEPG